MHQSTLMALGIVPVKIPKIKNARRYSNQDKENHQSGHGMTRLQQEAARANHSIFREDARSVILSGITRHEDIYAELLRLNKIPETIVGTVYTLDYCRKFFKEAGAGLEKPPLKRDLIIAAYQAGITDKETLAKKTGASFWTVKNVIQELSKPEQGRKKRTAPVSQSIIADFRNGITNLEELAERNNTTIRYIKDVLIRHGMVKSYKCMGGKHGISQ